MNCILSYYAIIYMTEFLFPEIIISNIPSYESIVKLYEDINRCKDYEITVSFRNCKQLDPNLAAIIGGVIDKINSYYEHKVTYDIPNNTSVGKTLQRIEFEDFSNKIEDSAKLAQCVFRKFEKSDADNFKLYIDKGVIANKSFPQHSKLVGDSIASNIYEIYVNAMMHGDTQYVYCCGHVDRDKRLNMTIVNCGKTIPNNVNEFLKGKNRDPLEHPDSIVWAMVKGNTTKTEPGGLGLALLMEFIELNKGKLQIVSGKGFYEQDAGHKNAEKMDYEFPGTIVNMSFNLADNKTYYLKEEVVDINNLL